MDGVVYEIDGRRVRTTQDFFDLAGEAVGGPGTYFGSNLDAFSDCLSGGFGTPLDAPFAFVLTNADVVRERLGYPATAAWLRAIPGGWSRPHILERIEEAEHDRGETLFDIIVDIFETRRVPLELR